MESLHSQGYHFGFSEDMQHQKMIEKSLRIINPFIGTNESSDTPIEQLEQLKKEKEKRTSNN